MIPDVPRRPASGNVHEQIADIYRNLAAMRDYIEYQLNVIEDRLNDLEEENGK